MANVRKVIQNPEKIDERMRLRVSQVPIKNDEIMLSLSKIYQMPIMQVRGIIDFMGRYTARVITDGIMETVMLPGFGKITPNVKRLQAIKKSIRTTQERQRLLGLAIKGRNKNFTPPINLTQSNQDEAI